MTAPSLSLFLLTSLVVLLTPGPSVTYVVARSLQSGVRGGLAATLGLGLGGMGHVTAAVLGLSALLAASDAAFVGIKLAGAAYLCLLGIRALRSSGEESDRGPKLESGKGLWTPVREGCIVNLLNPVGALFLLAFLPQFADPARGAIGPQILLLGCTFIAMAVVTDSMYVWLASRMHGRVAGSPGTRIVRRLSGFVYLGLAVAAVVARAPS